MVKLIALIGIAGAIVGVWSGVVELTVHPEKLSEVPSKVTEFAGDTVAIEQARAQAVKLSRKGEQYITKDDKQLLQLSLAYVEADARRLEEKIKDGHEPAYLVPQARLLTESIRMMQGNISEASDETLAAIQSDAIKTTGAAGSALAQLQKIETDREDFQSTTDVLATLLGKSDTGQVAGTEDRSEEPTPDASSRPEGRAPSPSNIPLRF